MDVFELPQNLSQQVKSWKKQQRRIAFVPTMGNLHAGHLSLVEKAKTVADIVVVSIFVNPMQFSAGEDFDAYPRTLDADKQALENIGVNALFLPTNRTMYPHSVSRSTQVYVPEVSELLCGASRPGHFRGVTTIVNKFFNIVQPDVAIFGQKDFQQVAIIRQMVANLFMPVDIIALPTMREKDGLAMSSRNQYLTEAEREKAGLIYQLMQEMSEKVKTGVDIASAESEAKSILQASGFQPEYFSFRDPVTLQPLQHTQADMVLLVAAKLGNTRLIDNWLFSCEVGRNSA